MIKSFKTKRGLIQAGCSLCLFIFLKELYSLQQRNVHTIVEEMFPSIEDLNFTPKEDSIYFHVTSLQGFLKPTEACAVEAAARAHPNRNVYVLFTSPISQTDRALKYTMSQSLKKLRRFRNIKLLRIHLPKYSNGTLVQSLLLNGLKNSSYPEKHTADILKMLTLNKYGGVALETNMIVLRSLNDLPQNWILKRNEKYVAPGLMGFSKSEFGLNVTSEILKKISETYNSSNYYVTGRAAIEKVVQGICPIKIRWNSCKEMMIFPAYDFYSVENILRTPFDKIALSQVSFSFHLKTLTRAESPFVSESIIRIFCPSIFWEFQQNLTY